MVVPAARTIPGSILAGHRVGTDPHAAVVEPLPLAICIAGDHGGGVVAAAVGEAVPGGFVRVILLFRRLVFGFTTWNIGQVLWLGIMAFVV